MAMPSIGNPISIKQIFNEMYAGDSSAGYTPTPTQVSIGYTSLWTLEQGAYSGYGGFMSDWDNFNGNGSKPTSMSEFYSGRRDGIGGE